MPALTESSRASTAQNRAAYAARQSEFVRALVAGGPVPEGVDASRERMLVESLQRKRARAVARSWPALRHGLGAGFDARFATYALGTPPPADSDAIADGLAFAASLRAEALDDQTCREILVARSRFAIRRGRAHARRMPYIGVMTPRQSERSVLLALRAPALGERVVRLPV